MSLHFNSKKRWIRTGSWTLVILAVLLLCFVATGLGSSESGEHGVSHETRGWMTTDTYRVMNFLVLAVALVILLRKPLKQALNGRITEIQSQLNELEAKKKEAEARLAEYNDKLAMLDQESESIVAKYIRQGEEARQRILKEAAAASEKLEAQARRNIQSEFKRAKEKLHKDVLEKALARAEALIKENVTDMDQDKLVDDYLKKVVET